MSDSKLDESRLDDVAAELYAVDPSEFVAARKAAAADARKSRNRGLAIAIGKLRKPTTVGWMVNLLVREEPEDVADLFDLGDSLREAQRRSDAHELRSLSAARQKLVRTLSARAAKLAEQHGHSSTEDAIREVGQTLGAALADPDIAERVRAGRVVTAESYSGFGPAVLSLVPDADEAEEAEEPGSDDVEEAEDDDPEHTQASNEASKKALKKAQEKAQEELDEARRTRTRHGRLPRLPRLMPRMPRRR